MASVQTIPYAVGGPHVAAGVSPPLNNGVPPNASVLRFLDGDRLNLTTVTIALGNTVTWTNLDYSNPHTVTFPVAGQQLPTLPGEPFSVPMGGSTYDGTQITNSGVLQHGDSYNLTFTKRGTFTYECLFHDGQGMIGTVIVQ
jgi:plastocyanin